MQFENILLKFTRIFNLLGESCVLPSDFQQSTHSIKDRIIPYFISFISLSLIVIFLSIDFFVELENVGVRIRSAEILFSLLILCFTLTKAMSISQMFSLTKLLPMAVNHLKELDNLAKPKYKIDVYQFRTNFYNGVMKILGAWLLSLISTIFFSRSRMDALTSFCEMLAVLLNRITICHVYFYLVLVQSLISYHLKYIEQRVSTVNSNISLDFQNEIIFMKINHFKLYEISNVFNVAFGWILITIFIQTFIESINDFCWFFSIADCTHFYRTLCN